MTGSRLTTIGIGSDSGMVVEKRRSIVMKCPNVAEKILSTIYFRGR